MVPLKGIVVNPSEERLRAVPKFSRSLISNEKVFLHLCTACGKTNNSKKNPFLENSIENAVLDEPLEYIRFIRKALRQAAQPLTESVKGNAMGVSHLGAELS